MHTDLTATLASIAAGRLSPAEPLADAMAVARSPACTRAFSGALFNAALEPAAMGPLQALPFCAMPVTVKDLFDLQGQPTPAGSLVLRDALPAAQDAVAVRRLKAAGASVIGRTNMSEFAFSGVGVNPHLGTPANPADTRVERIPGGSSSGAAVSVASGAAFIGLGSDTGGSIRIPAALCGIVGFKSTARLVPTTGALPLSSTLDTVCALTRSVRDAVLTHEILAQRRVVRSDLPLSAYRLAVPRSLMLESLETKVALAFESALDALRGAGAHVQDIDLPPLLDMAGLQAGGGFAAAESFAWHRELLARYGDGYDPRVRFRIARGEAMAAHEYIALHTSRHRWIAQLEAATRDFDALLSPTVPITAPPIADVAPADGRDAAQDAARDEAFFRINSLLLRNTSVVNLLDGCAISIPCQRAGELPVGLMVWHGALRDDTILNIAALVEGRLANITRD